MDEINILEEKILGLIREATENKDYDSVGKLSSIAKEIERIKKSIKKIEKSVESFENPQSSVRESDIGNSTVWEVTGGAIRQNLLTITKAKKAGLMPPLGEKFEIVTSVGLTFQTDELPNHNRLRERSKIREFYEKAGIEAGDKVSWIKLEPNKYHLDKVYYPE